MAKRRKHSEEFKHGAARLAVATAIHLAAMASPSGLQGQRSDTAWVAKQAADCRLAAQVLVDGHPAAKREWAIGQSSVCVDVGGDALSTELRRHVQVLDPEEQPMAQIVFVSRLFVDSALAEAGLDVALDPDASTIARVQAMRVLSNQLAPGTFVSYQEFLTPGTIGAGGHIPSSEGPTVGRPLSRDLVARVQQALGVLANDQGAPAEVRTAAAIVSAQAYLEARRSASEPETALPPVPVDVQVSDSILPPVPSTRWSAQADTFAFPLTHADSALTLYRTVAGLQFHSSATGLEVRTLLRDFNAEIIAGEEDGVGYIVRFPDPGTDPGALRRVLERMRKYPGVRLAYPLARRRPFGSSSPAQSWAG